MTFTYNCHGTCSRAVTVVIENNIIKKVVFIGGCAGNSAGIAALVEGMEANTVMNCLRGIRCGSKDTSCPDQLAHAIEAALIKNNSKV
ncbi:MAG: TIGR03905 family TSCPD domain-containing protein [Bacillota bacterium]|nr:TIGR03905 family TSCPD domain-containing protein [Bacillota bacterium]